MSVASSRVSVLFAQSAVDRCLRPMIGDEIVARAGADDVGATPTIDRVVPAAVMIVLVAVEPMTFKLEDNALASRFSNRVTLTASPVVSSVPAATEKSTWVVPPKGRHHQRIAPAAAVDRGFSAVIDDGVVACSRGDDIRAPRTIKGVVPRTTLDAVGAGRSGDVTPTLSGDASTLVKLATIVASPLVTSALPRFTVAAASSNNVYSCRSRHRWSFPCRDRRSCHRRRGHRSCRFRRPPSIVSLPAPPMMIFATAEPVIETGCAEVIADASTFWKFVTVVLSPPV